MKYFKDRRCEVFVLIAGLFFFKSQIVDAPHLELAWDVSNNPDIFSYNIYRAIHEDSCFSLLGAVHHPHRNYIDDEVKPNTHYFYAATSVDKIGNESGFSNIIDTILTSAICTQQLENSVLPTPVFELFQNNPNPFNLFTTISYKLNKSNHVELTIFNVNSEEVFEIVDEYQPVGHQKIEWRGVDRNGSPVSSGIYYLRLRSSNQTMFRKMILLK